MYDKLRAEVLPLIERDFKLKHISRTKYMRKGRCPVCKQDELYTFFDSPWMLICGRGKCGTQLHIKDLYEDLFNSWSERAPATEQHPTATARAYLEYARGFRLELIEGWFTQETYWSREANAGSATVRFALEKGGFWERLIDKPERFGSQKARFKPGESYKGAWWCPPSVDLKTVSELWIVEGIFDSIALLHHDVPAVSMMSNAPFPDISLQALIALRKEEGLPLPRLVWALDNDPVTRGYIRKWVKQARELGFKCEAAQVERQNGRKVDWNDLHHRWAFIDDEDARAARVAKDLDEARYQGSLLIAESASEKALLMYQRNERQEFYFRFDSRLYWWSLDIDKYNKAVQALESSDDAEAKQLNNKQVREKALRMSGCVVEIANCYPTALYYQCNKLTDESWYYLRVDFPHGAASVKNTFTSTQLAAATEFKKRLLGMAAGAMYTGTGQQLEKIMKHQLYGIKTVETVDFIGYSREHNCYVFNDVAAMNGRIHKINEEDYFDLDHLSIKSLSQSPSLVINTKLSEYRDDWFDLLWQCFGAKGVVVLAWWFGCLFAEQIRRLQKSYPFLELNGEGGAGKSTILEFFWKFCGRLEYEGFDPLKSTFSGRARNFAQVGNLPVVLIESDREQPNGEPVKQYDWDETKPLYNGRGVRAIGVKNSGNDTYEPPFRAGLLIAQNNPVSASQPVMQRIVHVGLSKEHHTAQSKLLIEQLERMPMEHVSGFMLKALTCEQQVLQLLEERTSAYEQELLANPEVRTVRIAKNHAQLRALVDALPLVVPISQEQVALVHGELTRMAAQRQQDLNADHPTVVEFWNTFDFLNGDDEQGELNHSRREGLIALNLNEFAEKAAIRRQRAFDLTELKRLLKTSRSPKFIEANRPVNSSKQADAFNKPRTVRCWIFQDA